jgi:hypothetical protein
LMQNSSARCAWHDFTQWLYSHRRGTTLRPDVTFETNRELPFLINYLL